MEEGMTLCKILMNVTDVLLSLHLNILHGFCSFIIFTINVFSIAFNSSRKFLEALRLGISLEGQSRKIQVCFYPFPLPS